MTFALNLDNMTYYILLSPICGPIGTACWPIDPVLAKGRVTGSTQDEFLPRGSFE